MTFLAHTFNFFFQQQPFSPLFCRLQLAINQCLKKIPLLLLSYFPPIPHIKKNYTSKR